MASPPPFRPTGGERDQETSSTPESSDTVPTATPSKSRKASMSGENKVRFSIDADVRPTRNRPALWSEEDEDDGPGYAPVTMPTSSTANNPPAAAPRTSFNRSRGRGGSLRRSILASNSNKQPADGSTIEMVPSVSSGLEQFSKDNASKHASKQPTIDVIEEGDSEDLESLGRSKSVTSRFSDAINSLPLYQQWVSGQKPKPAMYYKVHGVYARARDFVNRINVIPPSADGRHVRLVTVKSQDRIDERTNKEHIDNTIRSTRYTALNFVPKQLWAQFGKLANFYFLAVATMQMVPGLSTTGTYTTIIPLLIFVSISMAKEGYEDVRRRRLDKEENERAALILDRALLSAPPASPTDRKKSISPSISHSTSFGWREEKWQNVRVGDVLLLHRDDLIPADIVILHADDPTNTAYVETKSLDGETNLKSKRPVNELTKHCQEIDTIGSIDAEFIVEDPNLDLYKFEGRMNWKNEAFPITNNEVILRGSTLRNTRTAVGLVIYSGEECKIRMNANKNPRVKAPTMQAIVNRVVILVAAMVFFISIIMTILYQVWRAKAEKVGWYLYKARVPFGHILASFIIMFNTMLPLSLYVSMEIVKLAQMFLMNDIDMYDAESDIPMEPRTSTINEELGQVSYIFSDKTGTLTNNSMRFRKMSIAGTAWLHDADIKEEMAKEAGQNPSKSQKRNGKSKTLVDRKDSSVAPNEGGFTRVGVSVDLPEQSVRSSVVSTEWNPPAKGAGSLHTGKTDELLAYLRRKPQTIFSRKVRFFIISLALCHTCLPEKDDNGKITFQAASPDELALVTAAQDLGWEVIDRTPTSLTVRYLQDGDPTQPIEETFEILDVIEFTSARKRMSIVMRLPDGRVILFTKGADTTIRLLLRLNSLAAATSTLVERRASVRKSMEVQEVLRRKSVQLTTWGRPSLSNPSGAPMVQNVGRPSFSNPVGMPILRRQSSIAMQAAPSTRQSIDVWLKEKEDEVDHTTPRKSNQFYAPRPSIQLQPQHSFPGRLSVGLDSTASTEDSDDDDEFVEESLVLNDAAVFERCFQHVDDFATEGLRTLLYAYRYMSQQEYTEWKEIYVAASTSLVDREMKMEQAGEMIEVNLELLGATAIEDKLQKGVPDAIDRLRRAGIKLWMLTGDKRETAINIGHSCRLIKDYSTISILDHMAGDLQHQLGAALNQIKSRKTAHSVLVIDGATLKLIDAEASSKAIFTELAIKADAVVCCRASPSQKAGLVRTIRLKVKGSVTLAIGDGANDIAMIQEAHLGIGIAGKEGLQAARTSDYSIAQFRFLLKLLLAHGRWNYVRISKYTLGTFWKEMTFYIVQALYQRYNGYTGTSFFEPWSMSMFNTLFTSLPVIFLGVFEKDLAASTLLAVPELYNYGQRNRGFNFGVYVWWATLGTVESIIIYFCSYKLFGLSLFTRDNTLFAMGTIGFSVCVILTSLKLQAFELHNKTFAAGVAIFLSVGGWWAWNLALSSFYPHDPVYDVQHSLLSGFGRNGLWWLTLAVTLLAVVMLEVILKTAKAFFDPTDVDTFQALEQDPEIRRRFEEASADLLCQGWAAGSADSRKSSMASLESVRKEEEAEREAYVQELLNRPRTMDTPQKPAPLRRRHSGSTDDGETAFKLGYSSKSPTVTQTTVEVEEVTKPAFIFDKKR